MFTEPLSKILRLRIALVKQVKVSLCIHVVAQLIISCKKNYPSYAAAHHSNHKGHD